MQKRAPLLAVTLVCALALASTNARADGDVVHGSIDYWLEARPYTCSQYLSSLARELTLACDAAGGLCAVARSEETAKRYLVFHCQSSTTSGTDAWSVEATDEKGARRWAADLTGPVDDRMRGAALWVVRAEGGEALVAPTTTPPPTLSAPAKDEVGEQTTASRGSTLMLAARTTLGFTSSADPGAALGVAGMWGGRIIPELNVGIAAGYDRIVAVENRYVYASQTSSGHAGVVLGLGAPFDVKWYGVQVEGGPAATSTQTDLRAYWYFRGALTAQLFPSERSRPWAAVSFTQATDEAGPLRRLVSLDLGYAWSP